MAVEILTVMIPHISSPMLQAEKAFPGIELPFSILYHFSETIPGEASSQQTSARVRGGTGSPGVREERLEKGGECSRPYPVLSASPCAESSRSRSSPALPPRTGSPAGRKLSCGCVLAPIVPSSLGCTERFFCRVCTARVAVAYALACRLSLASNTQTPAGDGCSIL